MLMAQLLGVRLLCVRTDNDLPECRRTARLPIVFTVANLNIAATPAPLVEASIEGLDHEESVLRLTRPRGGLELRRALDDVDRQHHGGPAQKIWACGYTSASHCIERFVHERALHLLQLTSVVRDRERVMLWCDGCEVPFKLSSIESERIAFATVGVPLPLP
jgi:hypothetical protein